MGTREGRSLDLCDFGGHVMRLLVEARNWTKQTGAFYVLMFVVGIATMIYGIWLIYAPAAFVFGGAASATIAYLAGKENEPPPEDQ